MQTLNQQEWHDLSIVLKDIIAKNSTDIEFKDIILVHKAIEEIYEANKEYSDKSYAITKQRDELLKVAQTKIDSTRAELKKKYPEDDEKVSAGLAPIVKELQDQLADEVVPQFNALNEESTDLEIELSEDKHKAIVSVFEAHAKDKYNNKSAMVTTYEKLTAWLKPTLIPSFTHG